LSLFGRSFRRRGVWFGCLLLSWDDVPRNVRGAPVGEMALHFLSSCPQESLASMAGLGLSVYALFPMFYSCMLPKDSTDSDSYWHSSNREKVFAFSEDGVERDVWQNVDLTATGGTSLHSSTLIPRSMTTSSLPCLRPTRLHDSQNRDDLPSIFLHILILLPTHIWIYNYIQHYHCIRYLHKVLLLLIITNNYHTPKVLLLPTYLGILVVTSYVYLHLCTTCTLLPYFSYYTYTIIMLLRYYA
jgi:hypothetical protein